MTNQRLCGCGCGEAVRPGRVYAAPSHALPRTRSKEHNAKIGLSNIESNIARRGDNARGKVCPQCKQFKAEEEYGVRSVKNSLGVPHLKSWCRQCERTAPKPKQSKEYRRKHHLKWRYGISHEDYVQMLSDQGGGCAVCGTTEIGDQRASHFHVDHCHTSGKVRGLLCMGCNAAIGSAGDDPSRLRALADYLERPR